MTFKQWVQTRARETDNPAGDLVHDCRGDNHFPEGIGCVDDLRSYLQHRGACHEAIEAAGIVWHRYQRAMTNTKAVSVRIGIGNAI